MDMWNKIHSDIHTDIHTHGQIKVKDLHFFIVRQTH